jgi:hypothetical protein
MIEEFEYNCQLPTDNCLSAAYSVVFERHLVILTQGMAFPIFRAEDAAKTRVADEVDA